MQFQPVQNTEFKPHSAFQERLNKILCPEEDVSGFCGFQLSEAQRNRVRAENFIPFVAFKLFSISFVFSVHGIGIPMSIIRNVDQSGHSLWSTHCVQLFRRFYAQFNLPI